MTGYIKLTATEVPEDFAARDPDGIASGVMIEANMKEVSRANRLALVMALGETLRLTEKDWFELWMLVVDNHNKLSIAETYTAPLPRDPQ